VEITSDIAGRLLTLITKHVKAILLSENFHDLASRIGAAAARVFAFSQRRGTELTTDEHG
jgi:hypothetical protein